MSTPRGDWYKFNRADGPRSFVLDSSSLKYTGSVVQCWIQNVRSLLGHYMRFYRVCERTVARTLALQAFLEAMLSSVIQIIHRALNRKERALLSQMFQKYQEPKLRSHSCAVMTENSASRIAHGRVQNSSKFRYLFAVWSLWSTQQCFWQLWQRNTVKKSESILTSKNTTTWSHFCVSVQIQCQCPKHYNTQLVCLLQNHKNTKKVKKGTCSAHFSPILGPS